MPSGRPDHTNCPEVSGKGRPRAWRTAGGRDIARRRTNGLTGRMALQLELGQAAGDCNDDGLAGSDGKESGRLIDARAFAFSQVSGTLGCGWSDIT